MIELTLHAWHQAQGARFGERGGLEIVEHYGDALAEHAAWRGTAAVLDLSFRGRLCVTGADRVRFLNGQVTNNVKDLAVGEGCYAALVTAKAKLVSDLNIFCLPDELLLDFEPGLQAAVAQRLEQYLIADDAQVVDVSPHYGLLSVQGPHAGGVISRAGLNVELPARLLSFRQVNDPGLGEIYCVNQPRGAALGFDLFVPRPALAAVAEKLAGAAQAVGGRACGWQALEMARLEAGLPRFGADMDATNLAPEAGIESRAISYSKGCYIGQEVISRIRAYGQVAKALRGLRLADGLAPLPAPGDKLFHGDREVGHLTSVLASPALKANLALGYVRREHNAVGTELTLRSAAGESRAVIVPLPFAADAPAAGG